jgi:5'-deoxynucleotidase YfbR-like HD superfamily hydrolase
MTEETELARRLFEAYSASAGGRAYNGEPIPPWAEIPERIKTHWRATAKVCGDLELNHGLVVAERDSTYAALAEQDRRVAELERERDAVDEALRIEIVPNGDPIDSLVKAKAESLRGLVTDLEERFDHALSLAEGYRRERDEVQRRVKAVEETHLADLKRAADALGLARAAAFELLGLDHEETDSDLREVIDAALHDAQHVPDADDEYAAGEPTGLGVSLSEALAAARLALAFGDVKRATMHPEGHPESDATHTIMLILLVAELAREEGIDVAEAVQLAAVHDLAEAYAGDTNTAGGLTEEQQLAKAAREAAAVDRIEAELGADSWAVRWLKRYEWQDDPAARLVRFADKITPKLTHILNGGRALEAIGMDPEAALNAHVRQGQQLAEASPHLVATKRLFDEAHHAAVAAYRERVADELAGLGPQAREWLDQDTPEGAAAAKAAKPCRACSECDGNHHWAEYEYADLWTAEDHEGPPHPAIVEGHEVWEVCKHCDAWQPVDDDDLEDHCFECEIDERGHCDDHAGGSPTFGPDPVSDATEQRPPEDMRRGEGEG